MGSTGPNPAALAKNAAELAKSVEVGHKEMTAFLTALSRDPKYAARFDDSVGKKDTRAINALMQEAGMRTGEITIEEIELDKKIVVSIKWGKTTIKINIGW